MMRAASRLSGCVLVAGMIALIGGCAEPMATMRVINETQEAIILRPSINTAFISRPESPVELAPGQEWVHTWTLDRHAWVLVRFMRPEEEEDGALEHLRLRTVNPGQRLAVHATGDAQGRLVKLINE